MRNATARRNWLGAAAIGLFAAFFGPQVGATSGASNTTDDPAVDQPCLNGPSHSSPEENCNIYLNKDDVYLTGSSSKLSDGTYFFAVLDPGGQHNPNDGSAGNLSSPHDAYTNRTFTVTDGVVNGYLGSHYSDGINFPNFLYVQLSPYDDTSNPGGVYILAVCQITGTLDSSIGVPGVNPSTCKYDAFKIMPSQPVCDPSTDPTCCPPEDTSCQRPPVSFPPTVVKDAQGAYIDTWAWGIGKTVDGTSSETIDKLSGTVTVNYVVSVTHDGGTISGVNVHGTIKVFNPNTDGTNTIAVNLDSITDALSGAVTQTCIVDTSAGLVLSQPETDYPYECDLSAVPTGEVDNKVTIAWSDQTPPGLQPLAGGTTDFTLPSISFSATLVDDCVGVSDTFKGSLGNVCQSDASPKTFPYSRILTVQSDTCPDYPNTATATTDTTGTEATAKADVTVCGAVAGGLTIGFWNNKNGQGIIASGNQASLATYLEGYNPFGDLATWLSKKGNTVASYVSSVIANATCSGSTCNAMLKAQMLATALNVYFSDPANGNPIKAPTPLAGVKVDLAQVCKMIDSGGTASCSSRYNVSAAFGGGTCLNVSALLSYAAQQSNVGGTLWYMQNKTTQVMSKDAFDTINNAVAFSCT